MFGLLSGLCRVAGGSFFGALGFQELGGAFVELLGDPLGFGWCGDVLVGGEPVDVWGGAVRGAVFYALLVLGIGCFCCHLRFCVALAALCFQFACFA